MLLFKVVLKVDRHYAMKNRHVIRFNKGYNRRFISKDNACLSAQRKMILDLIKLKTETIKEPFINVKFVFHFPETVFYTKKGTVNKKLPDLSNLYELPQDALTKAGIIEDDWLINGHNGSHRCAIKGNHFLLEIELSKI